MKYNNFNTYFDATTKQEIYKACRLWYKPTIGAPITTWVCCKHKDFSLTLPRKINDFVPSDKYLPFQHYILAKNMESKTSTIQLLNDDQQIISDAIYNKLISDGTTLLELRAGSGKTFISGHVITRLAVRTLIIVPKVSLAVQTKQDLSMLSDYNITIIDTKFMKKNNIDNVDIGIMVINSAVKQTPEFMSKFGFVIMDEVHEYVSDSRRNIFWLCRNKYVMGMSATIDHRTDGLDQVYRLHLGHPIRGNELINIGSITNGYKLNVNVVEYYGPSSHTKYLKHESTDKIFMPYIIDMIMDDQSRWNMLKYIIEMEYNERPDANIYVFSATKAPLIKLQQELPYDDVGLFIGGISAEEITRIQNECRIILTTFGYASTGVSIVKMNTIIFATPQKAKMGQIVPRILRTGGDTSIDRKVIDIVDKKLSFLIKQHNKRCEIYNTFDATYSFSESNCFNSNKIVNNERININNNNKIGTTDILEGDFEIRNLY